MPKRNFKNFLLHGSELGSNGSSPPPELAEVEEQVEISSTSPTTPALNETVAIDDNGAAISYHLLHGSEIGSNGSSPPPELAEVEEQVEISSTSPTTPALNETVAIDDNGDAISYHLLGENGDAGTYHLLGENSVQNNNGHDESAIEEEEEEEEETTLDNNDATINSELSVFSVEDLELENVDGNGSDEQQQVFVDVEEAEDPGVNATVHEKESIEQDPGEEAEEKEEEETVITTPTFASTPPPTPTITSDTLVSTSTTDTTTTTTITDVFHIQSDRLTPLDLNRLNFKAFDGPPDPTSQSLEAVHKKSSLEQNGFNDPDNPPFRWVPPVEEEETLLAPRAPDADADEAGKIYCKSTDGSFGAKKGGVILRYQYEVTHSSSGDDQFNNDVVPSLESGITDTLLPVFFGEECLALVGAERVGTGVVRMGPIVTRRTGRNLRGSKAEEEGVLQQQQQHQDQFQYHRRLSRVVGIDSKPPDFALEKGESILIRYTFS